MSHEEADAVEGMAFTLDFVATCARGDCDGFTVLYRRPTKSSDCEECGHKSETRKRACPGYQAVAAASKWRKIHRQTGEEEGR